MSGKFYWNYPEEYYEIWKEKLKITPKYIEKNIVFVAEEKGFIYGYFSIAKDEKDIFWLNRLFIETKYIKCKIGTQLIKFCKDYCIQNNIPYLNILSDPNAKDFYEKNGAKYVDKIPEEIKTQKDRCVYLYKLSFI